MWKENELMKSADYFCAFSHLFHCCAMSFDSELWVLEWVKVIFFCNSPYANRIQKDTRACITEDKIWNWMGAFNFWKSTLSHSMTHNSANQHRIATEEVNMRRRKLRFSWSHSLFTSNFSFWYIWQYVKCTGTFCAQFIFFWLINV